MHIKLKIVIILSSFVFAHQAIAADKPAVSTESQTPAAVTEPADHAISSDNSVVTIKSTTPMAAAEPTDQSTSHPSENHDVSMQLMNNFMQSMLIDDLKESAHAVMPYVHKSLLSKDKQSLDPYVLDYSFRKAHENIKFYEYPVKVTHFEKNAVTTIGHRKYHTNERGYEVKYYLAKKPGSGGLRASLVLFYPANGGNPSISYMGNL